MEKRRLGRSNLHVAPLCLGGNVLGWTADAPTSFTLLDAFVDRGFDFIDTADVYAKWAPGLHGGESETVLGDWFASRGRRDRVVLATKVGGVMGPDRKGLSRDYIVKAAEASLQRLRTDYIDLYFAHFDDPATPVEETLEAFGRLVEQGKVRAIGASNFTPARLEESLAASASHGLPRYECLQPQYSLMEREGFEAGLEPLCLREGLGVTGYYSLASGFLTGKYRTEADLGKSVRGQQVRGYLAGERGPRVLAALDAAAAAVSATPAQVALAWLMARPSVTAPIASATSVAQLEELMGAAEIRLDAASLERLDAASR